MRTLVCKYTLFLFALSFLSACSETVKNSSSLIEIDVTKDYPVKKIRLQDIADVEYLALETTDDFLWKGWEVTALSDNYIVNADGELGNVLIFDRKGKGISHFNRMGGSGEEYSSWSDFLLDEENDELFVTDCYLKKIYVYNMEGKFIRAIEFAPDARYDHVENYDRNRLIVYMEPASNDSKENNKFLFLSKADGEVKDSIFIPPTTKKLESHVPIEYEGSRAFISFSYYPIIPTHSDFILNEISCDTIFRLSPSMELEPLLAQTPTRSSMNPELFLFYIAETSDYIFMTTIKKEFNLEAMTGFDHQYMVYDKKAKTIYKPEIYNDDYTTEKPMFLAALGTSFSKNNRNVYISILEASKLVESLEKDELTGELKEIAKGLDEEDNPVLMIARFK